MTPHTAKPPAGAFQAPEDRRSAGDAEPVSGSPRPGWHWPWPVRENQAPPSPLPRGRATQAEVLGARACLAGHRPRSCPVPAPTPCLCASCFSVFKRSAARKPHALAGAAVAAALLTGPLAHAQPSLDELLNLDPPEAPEAPDADAPAVDLSDLAGRLDAPADAGDAFRQALSKMGDAAGLIEDAPAGLPAARAQREVLALLDQVLAAAAPPPGGGGGGGEPGDAPPPSDGDAPEGQAPAGSPAARPPPRAEATPGAGRAVARAVPVTPRTGPRASASEANLHETRRSAFAPVLSGYDELERRVMVFGNDSLVMGADNKRLARRIAARFDPATDLVSLIGCSHGTTALADGNRTLALGRAARVKEELTLAGIDPALVLEEGCWAGTHSDRMPARGVVVTHRRLAPS